ncbi:SDR family NAD(P)-dependent oxidoreductase [Aquibium sp. LZ166]|uniref:SDR family NAD(P)-dependent oxidoreductase n=1 Tax=Aquibium pacificus TaxID=3153579 RepID=A0ABV3SKL5_9HYPH
MDVRDKTVVVTGGASGLGRATAELLGGQGARIVITDLPASRGREVAAEMGKGTLFVPGDVTSEADMRAVFEQAVRLGPLAATVHCAGRGGALRILDKDSNPGSLAHYENIVRINLVGSFNVLRFAAASLARNEPVDDERGVVVLTASIAGYEGQIGQVPYASSKGGVIGLTVVAARDLASKRIRVCTIAPGVMDTPILSGLSDKVRASLAAAVPNPPRLGRADEYAALAAHIIGNKYINGETIRIDGALRMGPK